MQPGEFAVSLSVAILCKNEFRRMPRLLDAIAPLIVGGGEIVAIDSGSTDGTLDILHERGCRIVKTIWRGFNLTRQFSIEQCRGPWVLCLDADEPPDPVLRDAIIAHVEHDDPGIAAARVRRIVYYRGQPLRHAWQPEWRLRLVRRGTARTTGTEPHDKIELLPGTPGRIIDLPGHIRHESIDTFADFLRKQAGLARASARAQHLAGIRGSRLALLTSPPGAFFKQLVLKRAFLDGVPGWLAAASQAAATLMKHAALVELTHAGGGASADESADPRA